LEAYQQERLDEAVRRTAEGQRRIAELDGVLAAALRRRTTPISFASLKKNQPEPILDLGSYAQPIPPPSWEQFAPRAPGAVGRMFGGQARHEQATALARRDFEAAIEQHAAAERQRQTVVSDTRRRHVEAVAQHRRDQSRQHAEIDAYEDRVRAGDRQAVSDYFQRVVTRIADPAYLPATRRVGYVPESTLLVVEWDLPGVGVVPGEKAFKYVKIHDRIDSSARPLTEIRQTYNRLVAQLALRAVHTVFHSDPANLVDTVVFNGLLHTTDPATGRPIKPCLLTLRATKEQFDAVVLEQVDPVACVRRHFAADVSAHPDELLPVAPVMNFAMADPRIVDAMDVISNMDNRPNLLELSAKEFEHFIQNLFTRMGLDTKLFQASGDGGIDCMAYDPTPITGGMYVIQAKLYTKTVPPSAVRDLFGTMQHKGAEKGIIITTSGYGPSSYEFANGKPLQLIDGTGLLALCHEHGIKARIPGPRRGTRGSARSGD
jgi:restriction system protein